MQVVAPFWFGQRQAKAEPTGDHTLRLTAPNSRDAWIAVQQGDNGLWRARLLLSPDEDAVAETDFEFDNLFDAWYAAFELYRVHVVT